MAMDDNDKLVNLVHFGKSLKALMINMGGKENIETNKIMFTVLRDLGDIMEIDLEYLEEFTKRASREGLDKIKPSDYEEEEDNAPRRLRRRIRKELDQAESDEASPF